MYEFFLEDIVSVARILIKFKNIYPNINFDLVISICMLCKIGLIHKDVKNRELGIHCLSWEIVKSELSLKKNFPEELSLQLQIIITYFNSEYAIKLIKSKDIYYSVIPKRFTNTQYPIQYYFEFTNKKYTSISPGYNKI